MVDIDTEKYDIVQDMELDNTSDISIMTYSSNATDFKDYLFSDIIYKNDERGIINIKVSGDNLKYAGNVLSKLYEERENDTIVINPPLNVNYEENLLIFFDFISEVVIKFDDSELQQISEFPKIYYPKNFNPDTFTKIKQYAYDFGKKNGMIPQINEFDKISTYHLQKIHDFSWLCEYLQLDLGIIMSFFWYRVLLCMSSVISLNDDVIMPPPTPIENLYRVKRAVFFLKHPGYILEPTKKMLDEIDLEIDDEIYVENHIESITSQFEAEQKERYDNFADEIKDILNNTTEQLCEDEMLEYAVESKFLNADDIERIKFDYKLQRFFAFHNYIMEIEEKTGKKINIHSDDFEKIKKDSVENGILNEHDGSIDIVRHFYELILKNYILDDE